MRATEILSAIEKNGGYVWLSGESVEYRLPEVASPLLEELRRNKTEVMEFLRIRRLLPTGVRLVQWTPVVPPVKLTRYITVTNVDKFVRVTLAQLAARLAGESWKAGNWSLSEMLEWLETTGLTLALDRDNQRLQ
ncbi:MAG TPA: hypothetical protein VHZ52_05870 [Acidobacteriaceae bacterium]|jgi:hypothetical protein|nr:hypothetical protein [Acidobacteriaceae bacterium]